MTLILGNDLAWGGWGWCLATEAGPLSTGHVALGGRDWRWPAVLHHLDTVIASELTDAGLQRGRDDPPPRVVIEEPPMVYSGADRRGGKGQRAGNQAATGYGLGQLAGAVQLWSCMRPGLAYPWLVEPSAWRGWMGIGGKGRQERKERARAAVRLWGWGRHLEPFPWDPRPDAGGGAQGDVAEAILLAVGAARNAHLAPKGPQRASPRAGGLTARAASG